MREMKFEARVQPGQKMKSHEEIEKEELEEKQKKMSEMKARMKEDDSEDDENKMESVEKIPEKKEEVKEAAPLAYDMESGTLLNNREELSEALKNIRKCDSDGEEIEDEDDDEEGSEDGEDESEDEDEDGGQILNPVPKFDSDWEAEEHESGDGAEGGDDEDVSEDGSEGEDEPSAKKKKLNPMTIQDVDDEEEFDDDQDEKEKTKEPKRKKKKLEPILTQVSQKGDSILSSYAKFRSALKKLEIGERITLVNSLCKKITSGTDADRQAKLRSLFQFSILSFMRNELHDSQGKSIGEFSYSLIHGTCDPFAFLSIVNPILAPVLYTICEKCPTIGEIVIEVIKDFADEPISIEFVRFFKIIGSLYSMSDFNHVIGLPVQIIATRMISKIRARNINDIALGLYLCSLLLKSGDFSRIFSIGKKLNGNFSKSKRKIHPRSFYLFIICYFACF